MRTNFRSVTPALFAVVLASAAIPKSGMTATTGDALSGDCNPLVGGAIGGGLGALIGGRGDRSRAGTGAAIGAAAGALTCMAFNYSAKQTKSSQQVDRWSIWRTLLPNRTRL